MTKKNKILEQIFSFFACFLLFFIAFVLNLKLNYGQFRFFTIASFVLAFFIQRFFMNSFVANPLNKCYNKIKEKRFKRKANETGNQEI